MFKPLLTLLTIVAGWSASHEAFAQPLRTVAFVDAVKFSSKAIQAHDHFRAALEEALSPKNWFLAPTGQPISDCGAGADCMLSVADQFNTNYVLRIAGRKSQEYGYEISLDAYSKSAALLRSSIASCDICDSSRLAELASKSALELLASLVKDEAAKREKVKQAAAAASAAVPPVTMPAPSPPPGAIMPPPPPPPAPVAQPVTRSWIPWTLIGVGAVAAVYGAWAVHEDGQTGSCSPTAPGLACDRTSSNTRGIVGLVGGGLMAAVGVTWILGTPTHTTIVTASANHVALNVRF